MSVAERRRESRIRLLATHGVYVHECDADEWLARALDAEATRMACGPADPAYQYFLTRERYFLEAATIAETLSKQ